jgi:N-ethylmaleimide reductase
MSDTATTSPLLAPITVGAHRLSSRIVMAPMARARSGIDRAPQAIVEQYYAQRASAGLIITEACHVSPFSVSRPGTSALHTQGQRDAWRGVVEAVHAKGGTIFVQLYHLGRKQHASLLPDGVMPAGPSAIPAGGTAQTTKGMEPFSPPRALERAEIPGIVEEFRQAALNAREAGFDGIEVHGANGYLVDQFMRDATNRRTDDYGGPIENRLRFLTEVLDAVGGVFGMDRVGLKISPHFTGDGIDDSDPRRLFGAVATTLGAFGAAYLHVVEGPVLNTMVSPKQDADRLLPDLRSRFGGPVIANGGFDRDSAERLIRLGHADLVAFGELFIANPDLVARFAEAAPLNPLKKEFVWTGGPNGYIDYPKL